MRHQASLVHVGLTLGQRLRMGHHRLDAVGLSRESHQGVANTKVGLAVDAKIVLVKQVVGFVDAASSAVFHRYHRELDYFVLDGFEKLIKA